MRWQRGYRSPNVDDRRGQGGGGGFRGGGMGGLPVMALARLLPRLGLPGILLVVGIFLFFTFFGGPSMLSQEGTAPPQQMAAGDDASSFVSFVLDDVQGTFQEQFAAQGTAYEPAQLVLFDGQTPTGCGYGSAATGPFYCKLDENVYIDLSFYRELAQRFGAPGDFAQAYVIAHEVGHHVQNQLGVGQRGGVEVELQADCFAGVWARSAAARDLLEPGDVEEGMNAAAAVGDDRMQRQAGQAVNPESWTHGSAAQRSAAFRRGFESGRMETCGVGARG